ncbi:MAG: hypothetical protein DMD60_12565 [Gemmatimonadetes bacterium]|nr:MAG: hypothetical protein DMD60_12565 [Gemmatimonadota bacterium]
MIQRMVVRLLAPLLLMVTSPLAGQTATRAAQSDFELGDQILLEVEGDSQFTRVLSVGPGPAITLPVIGAIPLSGVHRANLESYLAQQLARYMKNPVIHAKVLVRLGVLGEVEHPGYYAVASGAVVSDALMAAGGPTKDAKFTAARIEREGKGLYEGNAFQDAFARGMTVEGLGLRTGDRIIVPRRADPESKWRIIGILAAIPAAIVIATQLHR